MKARKIINDAAMWFDTPAHAILARCEQSGIQLGIEGKNIKAKGNREIIAAWRGMIQRHKSGIIAALTGQPLTEEIAEKDNEILAADYNELTDCIIELCQIAGYSDYARDRMLSARQNLYPFLYASECAYFRLQVILAKTGKYWSRNPGSVGNEFSLGTYIDLIDGYTLGYTPKQGK